MKKTVVFDFDGVIHSYTSGWKGEDVIPDAPVPQIKEAIEQIRTAGYEVVVVSTRCATSRGMVAVAEYLENNEIAVDRICKEKPPAIVYIDDRAICFDGNSDKLLSKIESFKPWYKKTEHNEWLVDRDCTSVTYRCPICKFELTLADPDEKLKYKCCPMCLSILKEGADNDR